MNISKIISTRFIISVVKHNLFFKIIFVNALLSIFTYSQKLEIEGIKPPISK